MSAAVRMQNFTHDKLNELLAKRREKYPQLLHTRQSIVAGLIADAHKKECKPTKNKRA